jgi:hypothetical protein
MNNISVIIDQLSRNFIQFGKFENRAKESDWVLRVQTSA